MNSYDANAANEREMMDTIARQARRSGTPAGLARFSRAISTRYAGTCTFCSAATVPSVDYAAVNGRGKWIAVCATCAVSIPAQVAGVVRSIEALAEGREDLAGALDGIDMTVLSTVLDGSADEATSFTMLANLTACRDLIGKAVTPKDALVETLRLLVADVKASPRNRTFAESLVSQYDDRGSLTDRQREAAQRMVTNVATPATPITNGLYVVGPDGEWSSFWIVRTGRQSGNQYAMRLVQAPREGAKLVWEYVKGGMATVRRGRAATAAEAAALGHTTHHCCFCGLDLTDDGEGRSVDVGYGPVCARKNGLPWG